MNHEIELYNLGAFTRQANLLLHYSHSEVDRKVTYKCHWGVAKPRLKMDYTDGKPDYLVLTVKLMVFVGPTPVHIRETHRKISNNPPMPPAERIEMARESEEIVLHEMALTGLMHNFKIIEERNMAEEQGQFFRRYPMAPKEAFKR